MSFGDGYECPRNLCHAPFSQTCVEAYAGTSKTISRVQQVHVCPMSVTTSLSQHEMGVGLSARFCSIEKCS